MRENFWSNPMTTFETDFQARLASIEQRAKAAGSNLTQLCKRSGIARATVERWAQRAPQTITKVDELEAEVAAIEAALQQDGKPGAGAA
jgi:DNA-binding IclR family transcriptional regulator